MHRRALTVVGSGTVLLAVGLAAAVLASDTIDPVFLLVVALWAVGGLAWIAAGEDRTVAALAWYQLVGVGVALAAAGMAVLAVQTALAGDRLFAGMQGMVAFILVIQAANHYRGGNITNVIDAPSPDERP